MSSQLFDAAHLTRDQKIAEAKRLRDDGNSIRQIANKLGVGKETARCWVNPQAREKNIIKSRRRREENPEYYRKAWNQWEQNNPDKARATRTKASRTYKTRHIAKIRSYNNEYTIRRRKTDILFKLAFDLRCRLRLALKNGQKRGSAVKDLGCTVAELKAHLESHFLPGMTWENHGKWHIDHKKPLASFDLTDRQQFFEACHYTNLQPLWAEDNFRKGARDAHSSPNFDPAAA